MKVFDFDLEDARRTFFEQGWVHLPNAVTPDFLEDVEQTSATYLKTANLPEHAIAGKKTQALYTLPSDLDWQAELLDPIATVCGLTSSRLTLSERHIQAYEIDADPHPRPHKDRFGSQISIGISISIPEDSRLVLWPYIESEVNTDDKAMYREEWLSDGAVEIADNGGDVVMFGGNRTWHARANSAGAVNLYFKVNEHGNDPLHEDPRRSDDC